MHRNNRPNRGEVAPPQLSTKADLPTRQYPHPELKLATAYVPPQPYGKQFKPDEALRKRHPLARSLLALPTAKPALNNNRRRSGYAPRAG
ncbi:MAG: spore coat associated protein CotJA [Thermodesulfitimonas sp.]